MAPTLRSSAPNTPVGKSTDQKEPPNVTPRKAPVCTKCKRPRAGHPRSGCPYSDSPTKAVKAATEKKADNIADALESIHLHSPDDDRAAIRERRRLLQHAIDLVNAQSVLSLDKESQEAIDKLLQPGMFDDPDTDATAKVVHWQDSLTPTRAARKRVKMPCSLYSPSPSSSQASIKLEAVTSASPIDITNENDKAAVPTDPSLPDSPLSVQPLSRSMSAAERDTFLASLTNASDATVYLVSRDDIHNVHADAIKVGFYARIILGKDSRDPQGLLVLGRNEGAVKRLYEQVEIERKNSTGFRAAAAGAVVGAVGAFAGLAFA
ncbi:hypothetical protein H0H92_014566 [Tricholoma furcatifolium]|nr:hypothetical protein H0H92_014566 [Tricholoma furcatifolium]